MADQTEDNYFGMSRGTALAIIDRLGRGIPPRIHTSKYSAGHENLLMDIKEEFLCIENLPGKLKFLAGSWGSGKTHVLRLIAEEALLSNWVVATVELSANEAPFNKIEKVVGSIIRNISDLAIEEDESRPTFPLGSFVLGVVRKLSKDRGISENDAASELEKEIMSDSSIEPDVKKALRNFLQTLGKDDSFTNPALVDRRDRVMQWFVGESNRATMRRDFDIHTELDAGTADRMLNSIVRVIRTLGYQGLVVLLDESDMTFSIMKNAQLGVALNNLRVLLDSIDTKRSLLVFFAGVPDFWTDEKHGIMNYGALQGRIGPIPNEEPYVDSTVWNIDAIDVSSAMAIESATKIRKLFLIAYNKSSESIISEEELGRYALDIMENHPKFSRVSKWRMITTEIVKILRKSKAGVQIGTPEEERALAEVYARSLGDD